MRPNQEPCLQSSHVPWPRIISTTFCFLLQCPTNWATLLMTVRFYFLKIFHIFVSIWGCFRWRVSTVPLIPSWPRDKVPAVCLLLWRVVLKCPRPLHPQNIEVAGLSVHIEFISHFLNVFLGTFGYQLPFVHSLVHSVQSARGHLCNRSWGLDVFRLYLVENKRVKIAVRQNCNLIL